MKTKILVLVISGLFLLAACSSTEEISLTAPADMALISSDETEKEAEDKTTIETLKETIEETTETGSLPKQTDLEYPHGLKAELSRKETSSAEPFPAEPSGEEHMSIFENSAGDSTHADDTHHENVQTAAESAWDGNATQSTWIETECGHSDVYISGFIQATCTSEGYSGDEICALCGKLVSSGYVTQRTDHSWTSQTIHEDAYLTCYCGQVFYSADDHDRHVNERVNAGDAPDEHGCVWTPGRDRTVYTCNVCGQQLNN